MSVEINGVDVPLEQLDRYSTAALLVVQARAARGNDTVYDHFLCDYVGDPFTNEITKIKPGGTDGTVTYNNPYNMRRGYTKSGLLMNWRHAEQPLPEDRWRDEYFVVTADVRSGQMAVWNTVALARYPYGRKVVLDLVPSDQSPAASRVFETVPQSLDELIRRRERAGQAAAQLVLDCERGNTFAAGPIPEPLDEMHRLVQQVNELTEICQIDLAGLAARRQAIHAA